MSQQPVRMSPIGNLLREAGSEELVSSDAMKPYLALLMAEMGGSDTGPALAALVALPIEQRYVWRVVSALKWGLCDLETENVAADLNTLSEDDLHKVTTNMGLRAIQFSLFLQALLGQAAAKELLLQAINFKPE